MKKLTIVLILLSNFLFAYNSNVKQAVAIGIFDSNGNGENIQHLRKTKNDYEGTCYTKVFVEGNFFRNKPKVSIGNSIGHYESSKSIYKNKKKIGEVLLFKHHNVSKGYIKVSFDKKIFDTKVYVK